MATHQLIQRMRQKSKLIYNKVAIFSPLCKEISTQIHDPCYCTYVILYQEPSHVSKAVTSVHRKHRDQYNVPEMTFSLFPYVAEMIQFKYIS